jgi:gliding motility-associated-like protein
LADAELRTTSSRVELQNPDPGALVVGAGFVSSAQNGALVRATNTTTPYYFPVGDSSVGGKPYRFRPVVIEPQDARSTTYAVRFDHTPALQGLPTLRLFVDSVICEVNREYYHVLSSSNPERNARVKVYFDGLEDRPYTDTTAHWSEADQHWMGYSAELQRQRTDTTVATLRRVGLAVTNSPWGATGQDSVWAFATLAPYLGFTYSPGPPMPLIVGNEIDFLALDNSDNMLYSWEFGDGNVRTGREVTHRFDRAGRYPVTLTVSPAVFDPINNANACEMVYIDTLVINPDMVLNIPTAFSPNEDGTNDDFRFSTQGFEEVELKIYNRWGRLIFDGKFANGSDASWDGTFEGRTVPEGTYMMRVRGTYVPLNKVLDEMLPLTIIR